MFIGSATHSGEGAGPPPLFSLSTEAASYSCSIILTYACCSSAAHRRPRLHPPTKRPARSSQTWMAARLGSCPCSHRHPRPLAAAEPGAWRSGGALLAAAGAGTTLRAMHGRPEAPTPTAGEDFQDGRSGLDGITGGALPAEAAPRVAAVAGGVGGVLVASAACSSSWRCTHAFTRRRLRGGEPDTRGSLFLTEMEI